MFRPLFSSLKPQSFLSIAKRFAFSSQRWTVEEDEMLKSFIQLNGKDWEQLVSHCLPTRTVAQCRARWNRRDPTYLRGPFSPEEKELIKKGIEKFGEGRWKLISQHFLPHRSPIQISDQVKNLEPRAKTHHWTKKEDELLLKGFSEFGRQWTRISKAYLPNRSRIQIYGRYLLLSRNKAMWTDTELESLMKLTIILGQDWERVAAGIPGKTPAECQTMWNSKLDPDVNREEWSEEEVRLFWELMHEYKGSFKLALEGLPLGRSLRQLHTQFHSVVNHNPEFRLLYGEQLKQLKSENRPAWRARIAKMVCEWLDSNTTLQEVRQGGVQYVKTGRWDKEEEKRLLHAVARIQKEKKFLLMDDWIEIAKEVEGRSFRQCSSKYWQLEKKVPQKEIEEEDRLRKASAPRHEASSLGIKVPGVPPHSTGQCNALLENDTRDAFYGPFSEKETTSIIEGVQMFGTNWKAVRMTYLPQRSTYQLAQWWHRYKKNNNQLDAPSARLQGQRQPWTEQEDNALRLAVAKFQDKQGVVPSWLKVAKLLKNRTPRQCQRRWAFSLDPSINKGKWSPEEEMRLLELVQRFKSKAGGAQNMWIDVAKELNNGRTEWSCRMKFYYMKKKGLNYM